MLSEKKSVSFAEWYEENRDDLLHWFVEEFEDEYGDYLERKFGDYLSDNGYEEYEED